MKQDKITQAAVICHYQSEEIEDGIRIFRFNYVRDVEIFIDFCIKNKIHFSRPSPLRVNVFSVEENIDSLMEEWWNTDPEMRYVEVLCGQNYRFCVRLHQMEKTCPGGFVIAQAEGGNLIDTFKAAELQARNNPRCKSWQNS